MPVKKITQEDEKILLELYKAHYTAKEVSEFLNCSYATIQNYFRVYSLSNVDRYKRIKLIPKGVLDEYSQITQ